MTGAVDAIPLSPRATRIAPGETLADALRRSADAPALARSEGAASPRSGAAQPGESFIDALRRTATRPVDPAREVDQSTPRAGEHPFGGSALDALRHTAARPVEPVGADPAREAAEDLVAITMIQPVLASLRESNMAADPFGPGDAERRFGPMWDAAIARRVVKARGFGLVDAVARRVRMQGAGAQQSAPAEDPLHAQHTAASLDARRLAGALDLEG